MKIQANLSFPVVSIVGKQIKFLEHILTYRRKRDIYPYHFSLLPKREIKNFTFSFISIKKYYPEKNIDRLLILSALLIL
jgi:hypothetical protein